MSGPFPLLAPAEAIAFFIAKGLAPSFAWQDVWEAEHARAFTVAKAMSRSVLEAIREAVQKALVEGTTLDEFRRTLRPRLEELGWWGRKTMVDPLTGEFKNVQLGSPRRLKIIFNTNMRTAYSVGRYERQQRTKAALPIMVYRSKMDGRERPEHGAWHNTALPIDHPWWDTHYPPCDWECRCQTVTMTKGQAARRGLNVGELPAPNPLRTVVNRRTGEEVTLEGGIGLGWGYHVGRAPLDGQMPKPIRGFGIDESDAIASATPDLAKRFLAVFALEQPDNWRDAAGWPLAIGPGWLKGLGRSDQERAVVLAAAIARPDAIRLVWVTGRDGRDMLMRRYIRLAPDVMATPAVDIVDVGSAGWRSKRFVRSAAGSMLDAGTEIWRRDGVAIAAYNPAQPRHGKGSREGGRFRGKRAATEAYIASSIDDRAQAKRHHAGTLNREQRDRIREATGIDLKRGDVWLDSSNLRHIETGHGRSERRRGHLPVTRADMADFPMLLANASQVSGSARTGRNAVPRFVTRTRRGSEDVYMVVEAPARGATLVTMWKRQLTA